MRVIVDSREQKGWSFRGQPSVTLIKKKLETGDYSLEGYEDRVAIERKSLDDLIGTLTTGRQRFFAELERMRSYEVRTVVVEASIRQIEAADYRSQMKPAAILGFLGEIQINQFCPVQLVGSRAEAQIFTYHLLRAAQKFCASRLPDSAQQV